MPAPYQQGSMEGIPEHARARLNAMRQGTGKKGLFTSDLSVNEFLLVKEASYLTCVALASRRRVGGR